MLDDLWTAATQHPFLHAVRDGAIDRPMRVFTPAFGAGAVGGYTVVRVDRATGTTVEEVLPRHLLRRGQTPQAFRGPVIRRAYELAAADPRFEATDDCTVVLRYTPEVPIAVVPGEDRNMKVTEPDSPMAPPFLLKMERTLAAARVRLSVRQSTMIAAPPMP